MVFAGCDGGRCRKRSAAAADDDDGRRKTVRSMVFGACLTVHGGGHRGSVSGVWCVVAAKRRLNFGTVCPGTRARRQEKESVSVPLAPCAASVANRVFKPCPILILGMQSFLSLTVSQLGGETPYSSL